MNSELDKLDNPIWHALQEKHNDFAVHYQGARFYLPDYGAFGGLDDIHKALAGLDAYAALRDNFYVLGAKPLHSERLIIAEELSCNQMLLQARITLNVKEEIRALQSDKQKKELFDLVNLGQPGYFEARTVELGRYFGIYKEDRLVAVTGERIALEGFTEISAVVTHPAYRGKGYAKQLIKHTTDLVIDGGKMPFLHVLETNLGAIALYEKLGFTTRRIISFWNIQKV